MSRRVAAALVAAALGAAAGAALGLTRGGHYEASSLLEVLPPAAGEKAADVQAATYAAYVVERGFLEQVRAQVAGGQLTVDELADRVRAEHDEGTALVEIVGEGETEAEARGLAAELAAALIGTVQQAARSRALQVQDGLRRGIDELDAQLEGEDDPARLASLRAQRAELARRLAEVTAEGVEAGNRLRLVATPAAEAEHVSPRAWLWVLLGGAVGLLAGTGLAALRRVRVPRPRLPAPRLPERAARPAPAALVEPAPDAVVRGEVQARTEPPGAEVLWSRNGRRWRPLSGLLPDGTYLLRARGSGETVPVVVDNEPPEVQLGAPSLREGVVHLSAEAADAGSGVEAVTFMVSDGTPQWTAVPSVWTPPAPGVYWFCAVAADRAGNRASSPLVPLRIESL
ncbi:MAG: hypothetical protein WD689_00270 [Gaiellaceae bacterium]